MYDVLLMLHFIGLAMGVGTSFAMLTLGSTARRLPPEERGVFFGRIGGLAKNGSIGFALLVASACGRAAARARPPASCRSLAWACWHSASASW
jgi:hypothetical protein